MHSFHYQNQQLFCEQVNLLDVAKQFGSPTYVYSKATITENYQQFAEAFQTLDHRIKYAVKANSNLSVLKLFVAMGSGFDIVSGGELQRVLAAGGSAEQCTFAGVGKTRAEIEYALRKKIACFNVESLEEVAYINNIAREMQFVAPVALRINPHVKADTHKYISTGSSENKFGIDFPLAEQAYQTVSKYDSIEIKGIQIHIGSQLTKIANFKDAVIKMTPLIQQLTAKYDLQFFSIGGGLGIAYEQALASGKEDWWQSQAIEQRPALVREYAAELLPLLQQINLPIYFEPGRYLVGNAGVLLTQCLYEKQGTSKLFKIVDAGMNDLIRPALYEGYHEIVPLQQKQKPQQKVDVVGPVCETGDFFLQNTELPYFAGEDYIALMSAGAYGFVMASNYNTRGLPAEVLVDDKQISCIRPRQTIADILEAEQHYLV